jgi:hypothetical protein
VRVAVSFLIDETDTFVDFFKSMLTPSLLLFSGAWVLYLDVEISDYFNFLPMENCSYCCGFILGNVFVTMDMAASQ